MILRLLLLQSLHFIVCIFAQDKLVLEVKAHGAVASLNRSACLLCEFKANVPQQKQLQFTWRNGDNKLVEKDTERSISITNSEYTTQLCFRLIDELSLGDYSCTATVDGMESPITGFSSLESMPYFVKTYRSQTVIEGQNLIITCNSWGNPIPEITWLFHDQPLSIPHSDKFSPFRIVSTLELRKVTKRDQGHYKCQAKNKNEDRESPAIIVRVKGKLDPLWPFLGFVCELVLIAVIILLIEIPRRQRDRKLKAKTNDETEQQDAQKTPPQTAKVTPSDKP